MSKWMWIVAGPNGAGKTTIATKILFRLAAKTINKLNADERTLELRRKHPNKPQLELNILAAQQIDAEVLQNIRSGNSFFVETVLSTPKYRQPVLEAKKLGYDIGLIYVSVHPPEVTHHRIKLRVKKGGHDVEKEKAIERYFRSHRQLPWFARRATTFIAIDNSDPEGGKAILIAEKFAGKALVYHNPGVDPALDKAVRTLVRKRKPSASKPS